MPAPDYINTGDSVYRSLRRLILFKELKWGQRLSESNLAEQLGVSRTPVREALRRLRNDGFVVMKPNSGAWIASPSPQEVLDAYALRTHLECLSLSLAVQNVTPLLLIRLEEKLEEEAGIFRSRDIERYFATNRGFHNIIAGASRNLFLVQHVDDISTKTFVFSVFYEKFFDFDHNPSLREHRAITEALRDRDEERCLALIRRHLKITMEELRGAEL